ncbi:alpha/beta fold hydrolase (plasmid) [Halococcus dombrowskii]|jgi:haloalkane dehalogenase|uniref:Alpha/beta fold hydrolase n=1 Tax=Halococcus dombrowskii TaxID=179637 RepID=A0AAV3SGZ0_HALDO|nr:alpha/beta fold hydrolase [Halococcus dombrowskii]UOO96953.1 alpha/beta fold hydrolase [Halococcus dombrowskii]
MITSEDWSDRQSTTTVTVDGHDVEMAYYEATVDADGAPVVFLHGIPTWSFLWRNVLDPVAENHHVVVPDLIGYGNSTMRDGVDRSIRAQEQALEELLATVGADHSSLVAHDIGGGIALRYAAHNPGAVQTVVLSNAVCYDSWPVEFINGIGVPSTLEQSDEEFEAAIAGAFEQGLYGDPDNHREFVDGMMAPWETDAGKRSLVRNAVATNTNHTLEIDYEAIEADTYLLWGTDDVLQPVSYAEQLAEDVTGDATMLPLEDAYHWVIEDRTEAYRSHLADVFA